MYFGKLDTDSPASVSGTTTHPFTPTIDTKQAANSNQNSGARQKLCRLSSSSFTPTTQTGLRGRRLARHCLHTFPTYTHYSVRPPIPRNNEEKLPRQTCQRGSLPI